MWTYGIQLFGTAKKSNLQRIQAFQSKFLRLATNCPPYVSNETLHSDLKIPYVKETARTFYNRFYYRLQNHKNTLIKRMSSRHFPPVRRLRRQWTRDLL